MIDLNEASFTNPSAIEISKKILVMTDAWSRDPWLANNPLATNGSYKLVWRSLVGGFECIFIPIVEPDPSVDLNFLQQQQAIKKSFSEQAKMRGQDDVDWEVCISSFVTQSQSQEGKLFSVVDKKHIPSLIWGFVAGFMERYPDEIFVDHVQKVVWIDKPLYNYVINSTDTWMNKEIANLSSKLN